MAARAVTAAWLARRSGRNPSSLVASLKSFSTFPENSNFYSAEEERIFGGSPSGNDPPFFQKLDTVEKNYRRSPTERDGLDDGFDAVSAGISDKLLKAATHYDYNDDQGGDYVGDEDLPFRPDVEFHTPSEYDVKDLDLTKPGVNNPAHRLEFEVTTAEVLQKADFRNVRFLAKFITDAGIIIKRSQTGISAKAQRKVAREIKTARAFGLMPFTTMGTKSFVFGKTMRGLGEDFEYESFDTNRDDTLEV